MGLGLWLVIAAGLLAIVYGVLTARSIMSLPTGNARMEEIAGAIQEGARAYLNKQYTTIAIVGGVVFVALLIVFGMNPIPAIGFLLGAVLSGAAGYVGMIFQCVPMFAQHKHPVKALAKVFPWHSAQAR